MYRLLRWKRKGHRDRQTDRQTDKQTDKQTDRDRNGVRDKSPKQQFPRKCADCVSVS